MTRTWRRRGVAALVATLTLTTGLSLTGTSEAAPLSPGWVHQPTTAGMPALVSPSMAYDSATSQLVMIGSVSGDWQTWVFNGSTWNQVFPATSPSSDSGCGSICDFSPYLAFDGATNQLTLLNVATYGPSGGVIQTWAWTGSDWVEKAASAPCAAGYAPSVAYDNATSQLIYFGGQVGNVAPSNQTCTWDGSSWTWHTPSLSMAARSAAALAFDSATSQMVLFGGAGQYFGDCMNNLSACSGTWLWGGSSWSEQSPSQSPSPRRRADTAFDRATNQLLLFGGYAANNWLSDSWAWTGSTWVNETPSSSPPALNYPLMSYDSATGQLVLFGGASETWTLGGIFSVATAVLPAAIRGRAYTAPLQAVGGVPPYKWKKIGKLPKGVKLLKAGMLSGTPKTTDKPGVYTVEVQVRDSTKHHHEVARRSLSLTVS